MKKPIIDQTIEETIGNVQAKSIQRRRTFWKKPKRTTVASLSKAWGVSKEELIKKILEDN